MKQLIKTVFLLTALFLLSACGAEKDLEETKGDRIRILTTIFPLYDWAQNIVSGSGNIDTAYLIDGSTDLHNYQPSAADIVSISDCDVFIYVGGESDEWVEDALKQVGNSDMVVIDLLDVLKDRVKEESSEGIFVEEEEEQEPESDEHVWLSVKNAMIVCEEICEKISEIDEDEKDLFSGNLDSYLKELRDLDERYMDTVSKGKKDVLLFADRFPFIYLCDDYGIGHYAAFKGCSAETEASFETIRLLAQKTDELSLSVLICLEGSDTRIAQTVIENTANKDQKILQMDSMQSEIKTGESYITIMEKNLDVLRMALEAE
ncbi:MAG: metal ABC transporter substrate-binding protein [Erysipelotrichaceae bacterium]|nr:metal ABC transporter substrate-binding protein [Erysipelotrichaceae bacterium]